VALTLALFVLLVNRKKLPPFRQHPPSIGLAALSGVLDPVANAAYLAATRLVRLDIAVVLVSLYPAFTVLLSRVVVKERVTLRQWAGVGLCLLAIVLISVD
jgi:drug/metabolite transporter (DMT)-like permease